MSAGEPILIGIDTSRAESLLSNTTAAWLDIVATVIVLATGVGVLAYRRWARIPSNIDQQGDADDTLQGHRDERT